MIKRIVFILFWGLLIHLNTKAQYFNSGIKTGIVASQVDGDTYGGYDKFGFNLGIFVNYKISSHSTLELELEYIQKGSNHNPNYDKGDFEQYKMSLGYVQVPFVYQYKLYPQFSFELGIAFGTLIHHYEERDYFELESNPYRKFSLSYITGFNFKLNNKWNVNFRMDYSLIGIRQKPAPGDRYIWFQYGQFNNAFVLSFQYLIKHSGDD